MIQSNNIGLSFQSYNQEMKIQCKKIICTMWEDYIKDWYTITYVQVYFLLNKNLLINIVLFRIALR